jgi:uncharacterized protein YqiB (DUF1249 family)
MSNEVIETIAGESDNLALHVQLCEQRYIQLLNKLDNVDKKFDSLETMLKEIKTSLTSEETAKYKTYLTWAGVVITALIGVVTHFLIK